MSSKKSCTARREGSGERPVPAARTESRDTRQEVTSVKREPFPATPKSGMGYGKPDKTR
jgi:hypothetical protein